MAGELWTPSNQRKSTTPPFKLTESDRQSATWKRLVAHYKERLQQYRESNDATDKGDVKTAELRGQILEVKALLKMDTEKPAQEMNDQAE